MKELEIKLYNAVLDNNTELLSELRKISDCNHEPFYICPSSQILTPRLYLFIIHF